MEFRHPKYYKELRKRNKSDQVISGAEATAEVERAPGQGLKRQATSVKLQAASTHPDLLPEHGPEYYAPRRRRKR